ncbi:MAG: GAF domain-containing protein [Chloroflexi bacterium]|nr:GAF domain-containing protein [Chloroflexota bacterium]
MGLGLILLIGGLVIILGLLLWSLQRQQLGRIPVESPWNAGLDLPMASSDDAILVSREHGQLEYINDRARRWIGMNGGEPNLEYIAELTQPADSFLELFLREGQASFQLGTRWVEASSHMLPYGPERRTVVVMRELKAGNSYPDALDLSLAMATVNEIGETVNASMSIEQLLQTLLTLVMKACPAAAGEICLWDADHKVLHPRGWVGETAYLLALSESGGAYRLGEGITGWIAQHHRPALVADVRDVTAIQPKLSGFYQSFVGVPLILGERFIGTVELSHAEAGRFGQADLALLQAISKPIATAIHNAELYSEQAQRIRDMASLQEIKPRQETAEDSRAVYRALTERIARLVNARVCGVLLYDETRRALVAELPFYGLPDYAAQNYIMALPPDSPQRDIWENQPYWVSNDAIDEPLIEALGLKPLYGAAGIRSTAFIPMEIGSHRIGMVQVANKQAEGGFTPRDIQELQILVAQAAVVVENVRLYQREQRRETEIVGLQQMTHAIGALSEEREFYSTITERIARLMDIAMCGVLLWDETNHRLVAQLPFYGVPNELVAHYFINTPSGSPLYDIWQEEDYWFTNQVQSNAVVYAAGLAEFANTLGVTKTMIAALTVGSRRLGVIQVSNKLSGEDFTDKDARLLMIFAAQAAAIIENARLYRDIQRRAQEADRLREIAETAGAILTTDDSFTGILASIAELMSSPLVFINVVDERIGGLVIHPRRVYGAALDAPLILDLYGRGFELSVARSQRPFISNDVPNDRTVLAGYQEMAQRFDVQRAVLVPVVVGERSLGELGIANRAAPPYSDADVELLEAAAAQVAATIERIRLYEAAEQNLQRRTQELDAISRISNELTQTLELDPVLHVIRREAARATLADGGTIVLLKPPQRWANPAMPEMAKRLGGEGDLADIEIEAVMRGADTVLVRDYAADPLQPAPETARSAIAAAFLYEDRVAGVIHLYHSRPKSFDDRTAAFLMTIAAKASLAFGNNNRYQEQLERSLRLRRRVEQLNQIFELGQMLHTGIEPAAMLEAMLYGIQQSVGFEVGVAALVDEETGLLRRVAQAGLPLEVFEQSRADTAPLDELKALLSDEYLVSESYLFPAACRQNWAPEIQRAFETGYTGRRHVAEPVDERSWQDGDLLLVPLHGAGGNLLGLVILDQPFDDRLPDRATIEILEIFAHQASGMLENYRLYRSTLQSAEQEARLNAIMEAVSKTLDTGQIIEAVASGAARLLPLMQMTVALVDADQQGFDVLKVAIGSDGALSTTKEHRAHIENTALAQTYRDGQDYLYYIGEPDAGRHEDLRAWHRRGERTSLILPLVSGGVVIGAMHLGSAQERAAALLEYRPLLQRMANLSAVAIENARLFDRALNLQGFNESVLESIQQGIVVMDKSGRVISVNGFMRQRYGWDTQRARHKDLFAYDPQLAKALSADLRAVLESASPRELMWHKTHEDSHLLVRNFYIYPLRSVEGVRGAVMLVEDVTDRARLERDVEARANQLAVLTEVSSRITASLNRDEVIELALEEIGRFIDYDTLTLWGRSGDTLVLEGFRGFEEAAITKGVRVAIPSHERLRNIIETQHPYSISHLQHLDYLPGEKDVLSWMGVPLVNQGYVVGMIALAKSEASFYTPQLQQAAFAFANQMAVALANADLFAESQRRTERLSLLNRVSVSLAQSLDSENILEIALREIAGVLNVQQARALAFDRELQVGRVIVKYPRGDAPPDEFINLTQSAVYQPMRRLTEPIIYDDLERFTRDDPVLMELSPRGITAFVVIPMTVGGQAIGTFEMEVYDGKREFSPEQIELAQIISNQAAIAVQNTNLLEQTLVRTRELETLLEAAQATSLTLNLDEVFQAVVELMLHALDMDDCAVMMWDNVENVLEVQLEINRYGNLDRVVPRGTIYNLREYPARKRALEEREVIAIRAGSPDADPAELELLAKNGDQLRVLIPLVVRDQAIGLVQVETPAPHRAFGHREVRLAQALGAQAAIAIQNARLSTETAALVEEGFIINNLSQAISSTLTIDDMIAIVRDQVPRVTEADEMYLALYDPETQMVAFPMAVRRDGTVFEIPPRPIGTDEVSFIIRHRRSLPLGGGNWSSDEMRRNLGITNGEGDARSYLGVPIVAGDQVLGVLALRDSTSSRAFGINDERLLTTIGTQLGAALQNARLFEQVSNFANELNQRVQERTRELQERSYELQTERDRINTLYRITSDLASSLDMDRVLRRALELVAGAVGADDGVIMLVDPMTDKLYNRALLREETNGSHPNHPAEGLARWLIQHGGQYMVVDELRGQPYWDAEGDGAGRWHSAVAVLLENNDDIHGVMVLVSEKPGGYTEPQVKLIIAAANQVASAIYNAELYHLIRDQAEQLGGLVRQEREETEKSNAIVEGIADGVMLADAEGVIVLFNSAAERILDLPRDNVIGQTIFKLSGLFGESAALWTRAIEEWALDPERHRPGEFLAETLDLGKRVVSVHLSPVHIGERFLGTVSVFRDITKEVEVDRIKSEFVSNVSHELRTPMTSIKGFADLLLLGVAGQMSEQQQNFLHKIKTNADRLSQLVDDLLNISRIDAGERLNLELVDVGETINNVLTTLRSRDHHQSKDHQVTVSIAPALPPVKADAHKLTQIFTNLIDNAFNYTDAGGRIDISASLQPDGAHVLVAIKDTGIGIPEEFRSRIWQRFERYDEHALVMDVAGTGLGLSIVKELVEMHNGEVWFESELGKGTTFFVSLPIDLPDAG